MMYYRRMGGMEAQGSDRGLDVALRPELDTALPTLADAVEQFSTRESLSGALPINLNLVLDELITNTVSYALSDVAEPILRLRLRCDGDTVVAEVEDNGAAFDPFSEAPKPDIEQGLDERPIGGLGVFLVTQLTETAHYERDGDVNRIILRMRKET